jgi:hypothetical protein
MAADPDFDARPSRSKSRAPRRLDRSPSTRRPRIASATRGQAFVQHLSGIWVLRPRVARHGLDPYIAASGKITSAFDMARVMALGADWCNAARGFMFAVGCIQSQQCHTDRCPTGVATQDKSRQRALVVPDKATRVANFHKETVLALGELIAAAGSIIPASFARIIS